MAHTMFEEEPQNTFFIYDTTAMQNEYNTLEEAIVFYWPKLSENTNELFILFGQLVGMVLFTESLTDAMPITLNLKKNKYAVSRCSRYLLFLGHSTINERVPDSYLEGKLQKFVDLLIFYHGSIDRLYKKCNYNRKEFLFDLDLISTYYLGFAQGCGSIINSILDPLPVVMFNKASSIIFMKVNHILQLCQRKENVLCGCLISESTVISSQIPKELVSSLLLLKPNQKNHTAALFYPGFDWPFGVKIFKVYCTSQQYEEILKIANLSPYRKNGETDQHHVVSADQNTRRKYIRKLKSAADFSKLPCPNNRKISSGDYQADCTSFSKSFDSNDAMSKLPVLKDNVSTSDESAQVLSNGHSCTITDKELSGREADFTGMDTVSSNRSDPKQEQNLLRVSSNKGGTVSDHNTLANQSGCTEVSEYVIVGANNSISNAKDSVENKEPLTTDNTTTQSEISKNISNVAVDNSEVNECGERQCDITDAFNEHVQKEPSEDPCGNKQTVIDVNYDKEPIFANVVTSTPQKNNGKPFEEKEEDLQTNYDKEPVLASVCFDKTEKREKDDPIDKISNTRDLPKFYMSAKMSSEMNSDLLRSTSPKEEEGGGGGGGKKIGNEEFNESFDDGMTELHLYVQAHSNTTLMLLMTPQESYDKNTFKNLCENVLPQLGDIEAQIKSLINTNQLKMNKEKESIRYLKYCKITNTYRGNLLDGVTAHDRIFLETINMVHHQFHNSPSCSDVTFRTNQTSIYARQSQNEEVYYQVRGNYKPIQGAPSNLDVAWSLDQRVNARLKRMTNANFVF